MLSVVFVAAALAVSAVFAWPPRSDGASGFRLVPVAGGLEGALLVTSPPADRRLFVVQQGGRIRVIEDGRLLSRPFLDISSRVSRGGEQGLLGLAFHPRYAENGRFYVNYTDGGGDTQVVEYRASRTDPNVANPGSARRVLTQDQPFPNHNGGHLVFGPDGKLYVGLGDGGGGGDPLRAGQRLDTLLGKILRIDVDRRASGRGYAIPPDNPFVGRRGARGEIYTYGLRNPWRFSFDRTRGDLWVGDVGQNAIEEISYRPAASAAGTNFGWNAFEGTNRFGGALGGGRPAVPPVSQYTHDKGCSVTGGFVYRGNAVPTLRGRYVYADYCSGRYWTMRAGPNPGAVREVTGTLPNRPRNPASFGEDSRGELYVVGDGRVLRFATD
jgi:glucose/arabinose dehydrogenase